MPVRFYLIRSEHCECDVIDIFDSWTIRQHMSIEIAEGLTFEKERCWWMHKKHLIVRSNWKVWESITCSKKANKTSLRAQTTLLWFFRT